MARKRRAFRRPGDHGRLTVRWCLERPVHEKRSCSNLRRKPQKPLRTRREFVATFRKGERPSFRFLVRRTTIATKANDMHSSSHRVPRGDAPWAGCEGRHALGRIQPGDGWRWVSGAAALPTLVPRAGTPLGLDRQGRQPPCPASMGCHQRGPGAGCGGPMARNVVKQHITAPFSPAGLNGVQRAHT